tara:strand:+ start:49096 stop:49383 length:288 start_codon:yes stop_codon:yes gene_type:complete
MFWAFYILFSFTLSYLVSRFFTNKLAPFLFCLVIFLTPTQIETGTDSFAPAIFTFLFNITLEQDYSFRALRPLILSLPVCFLFLWLFLKLKKRFY